MASMIITYDLCGNGKNYPSLIDRIKSYPNWARITESAWYIKTDDSCTEVRDALLSLMDSDDRLFVAGLTGNAAWHNVICSNEYLKSHL